MDLVSSDHWWDMERDEFASLLTMTYMDDYWYMTLCKNLNLNQPKGWIATLLTESLDLRTHLCIAEKYPEISIESYKMIRDSFKYDHRPSTFLKKYEELVSTVTSAIMLSQ